MRIGYFIGICGFIANILWVCSCGGETFSPQVEHKNHTLSPTPLKSLPLTPVPEKHQPQKNSLVLIENDYVLIEKNPATNKASYSIKLSTSKPIFIQNNGQIIDNSDVSLISFAQFEDTRYILLPETHWFSQHFLNNPFKSAALSIVRPSIWGSLLEHKKSENKATLWEKGSKVEEQQPRLLSENELRSVIPNYDAKLLGQGGVGKVYDVTYQGVNYALKENSTETWNLERLQFTDAVVKIFAYFSMKDEDNADKAYLVMEKGTTDLRSLTTKGEKLSKTVVLDAIKRFKHVLDAEKYFFISNKDIKLENLIIMQDQRPMIIDMSTAYTRGYHGTEGELLARALLENQINQRLASGYINLDRYFEFSDPSYRSNNIASPYFFKFWYPMVCAKELNNDARCQVNSFEALFALFSKSKLLEIGTKINAFYTRNAINNKPDFSGTHDSTNYGPYRTGLPLPNLMDEGQVNWQEFYTNKDKIGALFCIPPLDPRSTYKRPYYTKHRAYCPTPAADQEFRYVRNFTGFNDPNFKEWILDAYAPWVMVETFMQLARENPISLVYPLIFSTELNLTDPNGIGKPLWELYQYEP